MLALTLFQLLTAAASAEHSAALSSLSQRCRSADRRLASLQSSLSHLSASSLSLQQQTQQASHSLTLHNSHIAASTSLLSSLQSQHSHCSQCCLQQLQQLTGAAHQHGECGWEAETWEEQYSALDAQLETELLQWETELRQGAEAVCAPHDEQAAEWEAELQRLARAMEVGFQASTNARMQHEAAEAQFAIQQLQQSSPAGADAETEEELQSDSTTPQQRLLSTSC